MSADATLCPYCNAVLPMLASAPAAPRLPCPRCGELVPAERWGIDPALAGAVQPGEPTPRPHTTPDRRSGVRTTLYVVLGIMLVMSATGLGYMLWTTQLRRSRDPWMPTKLTPIAFRRAIELPGLGYLPRGTEVVAAIQVGELIDDKAVGQPLLAEPRPGLLDLVLKQIPQTTGLKVEQLDHVVLGTSLNIKQPRLTMIVQTRQPYSLKTISEAVQPAKASLFRDQAVFAFSLKTLGEAMLWCVDERTLIFVVRLEPPTQRDLEELPSSPRRVEEVLPETVRTAITDRLPRHNFAWAAGRLDQLATFQDLLPLLMAGKADLGVLTDLKSFAVGVAPVEGIMLLGAFQLRDVKSAEKFQARLEDLKIAGATSQKVVGPGAGALEPTLPWVTWQVRGDIPTMREMLNRGKK